MATFEKELANWFAWRIAAAGVFGVLAVALVGVLLLLT